ncbi:MAG: phosphate/phosphite/phosphonate ABC transporter substrate-binding protein [Bacteriovoracaceae bacterium]
MGMRLIWLLLPFIAGCFSSSQLGTKDNPVKLYFTPSVDGGVISQNSRVFIEFLEKETNLYFKTGIPTNYISVVEAFGSKRADIGVMNSFGYILAHQKYGAYARLKVIRHGYDNYKGQIIAHANSGIKKIEDIEGKRFAFTDSSSTSGYLLALKAFKDKQITPRQAVFALKHDNVVTMIYQGQVDAGATFYSPPGEDGKIKDARQLVKTQFPDVEDKVKIVHITDPIPNDPFVFRKGLPIEIRDRFIEATKKFLQSEQGKEVFENIYNVSGVTDATDEDYDKLRELIRTIKIDIKNLIK